MTSDRISRRVLQCGFAACATLPLALSTVVPLHRARTALLDVEWRVGRSFDVHPVAAVDDPVVIAIDEASIDAVAPPIALWHRELGEVFDALAGAAPRAVMVDIALPERSFDVVSPGLDAALLAGVRRLGRATPTTFALVAGPDGVARPVYPAFVAVAGAEAFASALLPLDDDGRVRCFAVGRDGPPTLATALATRLGAPGVATDASIDYATGAPFRYVPLVRVLAWHRAGRRDLLQAAFGGRIVAVGSALASTDRLGVPLPIAAWEPESVDVPGALVHAQALRTLLTGTTIVPLDPPWSLGLALACAGLWWLPAGGVRGWTCYAAAATKTRRPTCRCRACSGTTPRGSRPRCRAMYWKLGRSCSAPGTATTRCITSSKGA